MDVLLPCKETQAGNCRDGSLSFSSPFFFFCVGEEQDSSKQFQIPGY